MATEISGTKTETEEFLLESDFISRLAIGETLSTCATNAVVFSGATEPVVILSGTPAISGTRVQQLVKGGTPGVIYKIYVSVRTSANNLLVNEVKLAVLSDDAVTPP